MEESQELANQTTSNPNFTFNLVAGGVEPLELNYVARGLKPFNQTDVVLFTIFIVIFMVFGLAANLTTIVVIATSNKLRSIFHFFIFSLCVSDAVSALISWINLYRRTWGFDDFQLPDFVCVLYWAADIWTSYSTAVHILSFAILRLISLRWPPKMNVIRSGYPVGVIWIIAIWVITFFSGALPIGIMSGARPKDRTSSTPDSKWPYCTQLPEWVAGYTVYTRVAFPIFFYVPLLFTLFLSLAIIGLMLRSGSKVKDHMSGSAAKKRRSKEKHAVLQLALIVTSFIIGYVPFTVFEFHTTQQRNDSYDNWWIDWHFGTAQYMCLRLSECLNPIFYNLGSKTMWRETRKLLKRRCHCVLPNNAINSQSHSSTITTNAAFVKS